MRNVALIELLAMWALWAYPFLFRAPHGQKRESFTARGPTRLGLLFEAIGIGMAFAFHEPGTHTPAIARMAVALVVGATAIALSFRAVAHLGRQFRIQAGLYKDHELVRTGPYAVVRHPIYASLLGILLCTILLLETPSHWALASLAFFILGTEIRVRTEDRLLASRFGAEFEAYRKKVPAYLPFLR